MSDAAPVAAETPKTTRPVDKDGNPLKPCCVCLDTKQLRDVCVIEKGREQCLDLIEAHKACMRNLGFNV